MAVVLETSIKRFIGLSSDSKPTGVPVASTFLEYDTDAIYVTYDGTNWVLKGLTPGVGAANLGKAEDAAHATGDTGVMLLAVRQDAAAALAGTDADYIPIIVNASGKLWTQSSIDQTTPGTTNKVAVGNPLTVYNATGAAAIALSTTMAKAFRLVEVTVHFSAAPTTSENLTVTLNANDGAAYDTVLLKTNPSQGAVTDILWQPEDLILESGDELDLAFANTDTRTYGARIVCEAV